MEVRLITTVPYRLSQFLDSFFRRFMVDAWSIRKSTEELDPDESDYVLVRMLSYNILGLRNSHDLLSPSWSDRYGSLKFVANNCRLYLFLDNQCS